MRGRALSSMVGWVALSGLLIASRAPEPQGVQVRHPEGLVHGFLALSTRDGTRVADGDLIQNVAGTRVTSRLVFHFKDGSLSDETVIFSQRERFRLLEYHLTQKGPTFPTPLEMSIDAGSGRVEVRYTDDDGKAQIEREQMDLPRDLANGMVLTLLKNLRPGSAPPTVSMIAPTPKPRLVKLEITAAGSDRFSTGGTARKAIHYVIEVKIGGLTGVIAGLLGKEPANTDVWILSGDAPAFVKSEGPLFKDSPIWRTELVSPMWPNEQ